GGTRGAAFAEQGCGSGTGPQRVRRNWAVGVIDNSDHGLVTSSAPPPIGIMHAVLSVASVSAIASASAAAAAAAERRSCGSYEGSQQKPALSDFGARWRDGPRPQERLSGDPQGCCETSLFTTTAKSSRYRP